MSSWSSDAAGVSVTLTAPKVQAGQTLFSSSFGYSVLEFIGEGCYGKVAKCRNLATKESVAVKILKKDIHFIPDTEKEVSMLEVISVLNPDHTNVVKFFERFEYMGQTCLAFEMLDRSLYQLVQERDWKPLPLNEIRPIAKQLLVALDALKGIGILHTDIKPDNVMFVNMQDQPLKIKLIDFGEAIPASKVQPGMELQPTGYRAPEVALGLPFTEAIDVWGVGCTMAFLYLAENLFPVDCDYQMMKCMVEVLGQPEDHLLCPGIYTQYYFIEEEAANRPTWRLMLPEEYIVANDVKVEERHSFIDLPSSLDDLVNIYPKGEAAELEDRKAFVDLIKQLLHLDGDQRISPHRALQNPFITESHLTEHTDSRAHPDTTGTMISICPMEASANRVNTSAASEPGFYFRGLPSGSNDDGSAIKSFDGTKAIVFNEHGPTTLSSDRDRVTYSDEDWADWSFDGGQPPYKYYEDTAFWYSDGVLPPYTYYEDPALWSSDGGQPPISYDEDLAYWSSDEGLTPFSYEKGPAVWSSDGRLPPYTHYEDSAFLSSDGGQPPDSYDEDLASWSSDEGLPPFFYEKGPAFLSPDGGLPRRTYAEDTAVWSSVEGLPPYSNDKDPAVWSSVEGLPPYSNDNDPAAWYSDEGLPPYSYDEDPVVCSSAGGLPPSSYDADPATLSSNGGQPPYPYDEDPTAWSSDGGLPPFSSVEDPASWSSDGAKPTDYTVAASASTGGPKRMIKWSYRFSQIMATLCCCCRTTVEV